MSTVEMPRPPMPIRVDEEAMYVDGPPVEVYRWLHANAPVYWYEPQRIWLICKWEDVRYVAGNPKLFTSTRGNHFFPKDDRLGRAAKFADAPDERVKAGTMQELDPPEQSVYRRLVAKSMTPRIIRRLEDRIHELVVAILDEASPSEVFDFTEQLAVPLPMLVIAELLGVPWSDRDDFRRWSDAITATNSPDGVPAATELSEMVAYFEVHLRDRVQTPREDLLTTLALARDGDARLAEAEVLNICALLLAAGNETTRNLISGGMRALLEWPDQHQKLVSDPSLIPNAVEEMLRYVTPVRYFGRVAQEEIMLRGQQIHEGDGLFMYFAAANRDPDVYADPDRFDVTRPFTDTPALSFGHGPHFCLGAHLARLEGRIVFEEFLKRFPNFKQAGPIEIEPNLMVNVTKHVPVTLNGT